MSFRFKMLSLLCSVCLPALFATAAYADTNQEAYRVQVDKNGYRTRTSTRASKLTTPRLGVVQPTKNIYEERILKMEREEERIQNKYTIQHAKWEYAQAVSRYKERAARAKAEDKALLQQHRGGSSSGSSRFAKILSPRKFFDSPSSTPRPAATDSKTSLTSSVAPADVQEKPSFWTRLKRLFFGR